MSILHNLSIRTKQWLGFAPILSILTISSTATLICLKQVEKSINQVVHESQPRLILTEDLSNSLKQSVKSLGFYLLTKEEAHREDFSQQRDHAKYILQSLITKSLESEDINASRLLKLLENELLQYQQTTETLLSKTASDVDNFPGIAYANRHINPLNRKQMQLASQMILSEMEEPANNNRKRILHTLTELRHAWSNIINSIRGYLTFRNETEINNLSLYLERTKALLRQVQEKRNHLTLDQDDSVDQFMGNLRDFEVHYNKLLEIHGSDHWRSDAWLVRSQITPLLLTIDQQLDQLVAHHQSSISDTSTRLIDNTTATITLVTGLLLLALILGISTSWMTTRLIYNPIIEMVRAMQEITNGDGGLMRRLNKTGNDELGVLADSFNQFVEKIRKLIQQTAQSTESVIHAVAQTSDNTRHISRRIHKQEDETVQIASAMNQMLGCISEIATNATVAEEATKAASADANTGCRVIKQTADAVGALADEVEVAEKSILGVEQEGSSIWSVLVVIKSIAEKTNLLALNAAIEAARAGEQGCGFAVVADQVRGLANHTQQSSGEIESMIQGLQNGTQQAVSMMAAGRKKMDGRIQQATEALESLNELNNVIETIKEMNTQIATASEQQRCVVESINRSITNISENSKQTSLKAKDTSDRVNELGTLAAELQRVVQQFRFSGDTSLDLSSAKSAHLAWKARIRAFLDGKQSLSHDEAVSHHECALGQWYYAEALTRYGDIEEIHAIAPPHQQLHLLVKKIINHVERGDLEKAEILYNEIDPLSNKIIGLLSRIEQQITNPVEEHN
jgi:methyl-accepting chemotaxis protein